MAAIEVKPYVDGSRNGLSGQFLWLLETVIKASSGELSESDWEAYRKVLVKQAVKDGMCIRTKGRDILITKVLLENLKEGDFILELPKESRC